MSLSVDGVWKSGVWATTVWAADVWREGSVTPPPVSGTGSSGGARYGGSRHWAWVPEKKKKKDYFAEKQEHDEKLQRLLKASLKKKQRQKELERIARIAAENSHAASDIRRAAEAVQREILTMDRLNKISQQERKRKLRQLEDEEDAIIALLLSDFL